MDPITIIGALASLSSIIKGCKSIIKLIESLQDGDKDLQELLSDVSFSTEALKGFDRVLRSRQTIHQISGSVIRTTLDDAEGTIKDLEKRLLQLSRVEVLAVRRVRWIQNKSRVKKLQDRLKGQNAMLQTFLMLAHTEKFLAVVSPHPEFTLLISSIEDEAGIENDSLGQDPAPSHIADLDVGSPSSAMRRLSIASSVATTEATRSSLDTLSAVSSISSFGSSTSSLRHFSEDEVPSIISKTTSPIQNIESRISTRPLFTTQGSDPEYPSLAPESETRGFPRDILVTRRACRYDCYCRCHEQESSNPHHGFSKFKINRVHCTEVTCQNAVAEEGRRDARSKSFLKAMSQVMSSRSIRVRYVLNTYRMIPEGSDAMRYVKHGTLQKLKACIDSGEATLWDTAPDGWSLLHTAVYSQQLPIVKYLLELGANAEIGEVGSRLAKPPPIYKHKPHMLILVNSSTPSDIAFFKSLDQCATQVEKDIVDVFSKKDDCIRDFEFTPIHVAVLEIYDIADAERPSLQELIQVVDDANNAPAGTDWAKWKLKYRTRSPLLSDIIEYFRASTFEQGNAKKVIHNLLDRKDKKNCWSPIHWAACTGRADKMKILLDNGADPFLLSNLNANIIHSAVESRMDHGLIGALDIWRRWPEKLNINQANKWAESPLHVAAWRSAPCVKRLLEEGADPNVRQEDGQVPLHCAALSVRCADRREIVSLLCNAQSKEHINFQDTDGRPPLFDLLDDLQCLEMLMHHGARLDLCDSSGKTAFHHACIQDESEALRTMLRLGSDPVSATLKDCNGNSPITEALIHENTDCAMILLELADVGDILNNAGWAAVHYAAKIGDIEVLEGMLKHPSFVKGIKTRDGKTIEMIAMEAGTWSGNGKDLIKKYNSLF